MRKSSRKLTEAETIGIRSALSHVNPFLFQNEAGRYILYGSKGDAYIQCMRLLCKEFPRGFVDVALFMMKYQRLTPAQVRLYCRSRCYAFIRDWSDDSDHPVIKRIFCTLLKVSGCVLDEECFNEALKSLDSLPKGREVREPPLNPYKLLNAI